MGFYDFFPVGGPLCVCEYFEILRFFSLCVGPLCLGTLRFYVFFNLCVRTLRVYGFSPMCGATVCMASSRLCVFPLCVGPVLETLKIFKKKSPIGKNPGYGDLKWQ